MSDETGTVKVKVRIEVAEREGGGWSDQEVATTELSEGIPCDPAGYAAAESALIARLAEEAVGKTLTQVRAYAALADARAAAKVEPE